MQLYDFAAVQLCDYAALPRALFRSRHETATRTHRRELRNVSCVVIGVGRSLAISRSSVGEEYLRALIENAPDMVSVCDADGISVYEGPSVERILGYRPDELIGRNVLTLIHEEDRAEAEGKFAACAASPGATVRAKVRYLHKNGSWKWLEAAARNLLDDPAVGGIVINSRDVTEQEILTQQLEQSARISSLGRLSATIAHEFNNVLMAIQPWVDLLRRDRCETAHQSTERIAAAILRGRRLCEDLRRFTRPGEPSIEQIELDEWLLDLRDEVAPLLRPIILELDAEPISVFADSGQLRQVFTNLLMNARDAMNGHGSAISITARILRQGERFPFAVLDLPERYVEVCLRDDGSGMPEHVRRHIFEPFFTTKPNGTGIGLAVSHQIVKQHGGEMFVESEVGEGTTFHIFLPRIVER
ncbi:MAG TPA: PAS domain S-box protein [Thermoanaerobaculia bacterium]|nr:PAS domain S-box protein [Thermoanaerobaculia bacterium]